MFWIFFVIVIVVFSVLGMRAQEKYKNATIFKLLLTVLFAYVISAGASFATDHVNYVFDYNSSKYLKFSELGLDLLRRYALGGVGYELGYETLALIGHSVHLAFPGFMFFLMLFVNYVYVDFAFKHKYPVLSLLFFCISNIFFLEANLVRQSVAAAIFVFSLRYIENRELWKCIVAFFVAMLFHISAVILLPVYLLMVLPSNGISNRMKVILYGIWCVSVLIGVLDIDVSFGHSFMIENESLGRYSDKYMNDKDIIGMKTSFDLLSNFVILMTLALSKQELKPDMALLVIGAIFLNLAVPIPNLGRIAIYFTSILPLMYTTVTTRVDAIKKYKGMGEAFLALLFLNFLRLLITVQIPSKTGLGTVMYPLSAFLE